MSAPETKVVRVPVGSRFALIGAEDLGLVAAHKWSLHRDGYALTSIKIGRKWTTVLMHRLILPTCQYIDHINGDPLDNRRSNLREVTQGQNLQNRKGAQKNNKTGVRNVHQTKDGRFRVQLQLKRKLIWIGSFRTLEAAAQAAKEARALYMTHSKEGQATRAHACSL